MVRKRRNFDDTRGGSSLKNSPTSVPRARSISTEMTPSTGGQGVRAGVPISGFSNSYKDNQNTSEDPSRAAFRTVIFRTFNFTPTGIRHGTWGNNDIPGVSPVGDFSPGNTRGGVPNPAVSPIFNSYASPANRYFISEIVPTYEMAYRRTVRQSRGNTNIFLFERYSAFETYLITLCDALFDYYQTLAIMNYYYSGDSNPEMFAAMSRVINSGVLDEMDKLRRFVVGLPIPPRLHTLVNFLSQLYVADPTPNSPILMGTPGVLLDGWIQNIAGRRGILTGLLSGVVSDFAQLMPEWRITGLMESSGKPVHSVDFLNFWMNLPVAFADDDPYYTNTGLVGLPTDNSGDADFFYLGNDVDVMTSALHGILAPGRAGLGAGGPYISWSPGLISHYAQGDPPGTTQAATLGTLQLPFGTAVPDDNGISATLSRSVYSRAGIIPSPGVTPVRRSAYDLDIDMYEAMSYLYETAMVNAKLRS